jgi:hypothetical protein
MKQIKELEPFAGAEIIFALGRRERISVPALSCNMKELRLRSRPLSNTISVQFVSSKEL